MLGLPQERWKVSFLLPSILRLLLRDSQGITSWDQDGKTTVSHQSIEAWRVVLIVLFFIGLFFLMALGQADL